MNYYNDNDPYCAAWLENLILFNHIPYGIVDSRPIQEVTPNDIKDFRQCHFFAGIGGWAYALRLAGWPDDKPVWTGSCPCQPFSIIGQGKGFQDERHLWPEWFRLIRQCRPATIFAEQVANALSWVDLVFSDLERTDYACTAFDIPAASIGARHQRQRLWFVADSNTTRWTNSKRESATKTVARIRATTCVVSGKSVEQIRGTFEPDQNWIVDGVLGTGDIVCSLGNSIVPQVAAEFVKAYLEI